MFKKVAFIPKTQINIVKPLTKSYFSNRMEKKSQAQKSIDSLSKIADVWVISNGYLSTPKSLLISFEQKRILVNCGEGTQRLTHCNSHKISKIDSIWLTRFDLPYIAGLRGLSMSILEQRNQTLLELKKSKNAASNSISNKSILIHSPVDLMLKEKKRGLKKILFEKKLEIDQFEYGFGNIHEYNETDFRVKRIQMAQNKEVWSYFLCIEKPLPNVDANKLKLIGVPPGEWLNKIVHGNDVTLENGR